MKLKKLLFEFVEPEATSKDVFGKYLLAPERREDEDVPNEPNTIDEDAFKRALLSFYDNNEPKKLLAYVPKILKLLEKHKYTRFLDPGEKRIYRGMAVSEEFLTSILEPYGKKIEYDKYVVVNLPDRSEALKDRLIQSWSLDPVTASGFAQNISWEKRVSINFVARTNAEGNNFFINGNSGLDKILNTRHQGEKETISFGAVEYDGFAYYIAERQLVHIKTLASTAEKVH